MSKRSVLKLSALAVAFAAAAAPIAATAEVSGNLGIANIYLWRGLDVSAGGAMVHGGLEYGHESGAYGGVWGTSEAGGSEYDLYVGYGTELGGLSVDLSYWTYVYPNPVDDIDAGDLAEVILALGLGDFSLTGYLGLQDAEDSNYFTLGYSYDKYGVTVGHYDLDGDSYQHVDLSYAFTDQLSFAVSKITGTDDDGGNALGLGAASSNDTIFQVAYSFAF